MDEVGFGSKSIYTAPVSHTESLGMTTAYAFL